MADTKITGLTADATPTTDDLIVTVTDPGGTPANRKVTLAATDTLLSATTKTLTNKTIDLASNTVTGTTAEFNTANSDGDFATIAGTETLTSKTLTSPVLTTPQINDTSADHQYVVGVSELTLDRTVTLPLLTGNDTFVFEAHAATLTNKTIDAANNTVSLTADSVDAITEIAAALKSGADGTIITGTAGTSGDLSQWNADGDLIDGPTPPTGTIVGTSDSQTLTNKTITTPTLTLANAAGAAPTTDGEIKFDRTGENLEVGDGAATNIFSHDAGTATLTNKTIDSSGNTLTLDLSEGTLTGTTAEFNTANSDGDFATIAGTETLTSKTLTTPVIAQINDANGNESAIFTATASAVNEVTFVNAATGNAPSVRTSGGDANRDLIVDGKGTGKLTDASGNRYLTTADEGTGNLLDADTVDGVELAGLVQTSVQVIAGDGLSDGGALTGNVTLNVDIFGQTNEASPAGTDLVLIEAAAGGTFRKTSVTALTGGGIADVVEDTTPQLGGNLDVNGNSIVSVSAGNITITPDTTGSIVLDGLSWPQADGTANFVLETDGAGQLSWVANSGSGLSNIVEDITPQLGAMLDVNTFGLGDGTLELLTFTETASAVNHINVTNATTTAAPILGAAGDDVDIDLTLAPKGVGEVVANNGLRVDHTSVAADDHALEIDANAAGFGDAKAVDIVYTTGAIGAGDSESVILSNINESAATGGTVAAHEILSTEGSATVYGHIYGAVVNPFVQESGTFADMDSFLVKAVDQLAAAISTATDVQMFVADNDTITIGDAAQFNEIEFLLAIPASGSGIAPTFEYSTGVGTWQAFTPTDGTNGMRNSGVVAWTDGDVGSWATGTGSEYLIRVTRTRNTLATPPTEDKIQIAATTEYKWDSNANVTVNSINLGGSIAATDTTLTRVSAGVAAIEGSTIVTGAGSTAITTLGTVTTGVWQGTAIDQTYLVGQSGTNTGDQTITLTGDVTGTGTGSFATTIAAKAVDVAMLADGTDGELITWSATGVAATVATGSSGEVLTSNGIGTAPTFQAAGGGDVTAGTQNNNEVAVWNATAKQIEGDTGFTWDGTGLGITGNITQTTGQGDQILADAGSSISPGLSFTADPDVGFYWPGTDILGMTVGSVGGYRWQETSSHIVQSVETHSGLTASVTQTQGNGALLSSYNVISTVGTTNDVVTLGTAAVGDRCTVVNDAAANTLQIFPASGDDLGQGLNTSTTLAAGASVTFLAVDNTNWVLENNYSASGGGDALVANPLSQFAATTSAQLASTISDETGTGLVVFGTDPAITTPTLILKDANGAAPTTDGEIKYDRTAETLEVGDGATTSVFSNDATNASTYAPAAGDANIVTTGALNSGSITSGFGNIDIGASTFSATGTITGPSGTWDAGGIDIATTDTYAIAGTDVIDNATTINVGVTSAAGLTTVGALASGSIASGFGTIDITTNAISAGSLFLTEKAAADADVAGDGQFWVKTATPNVAMFTDDAGSDFTVQLAGKETIWVPASAMTARTTTGAASGSAETTTNKVMVETFDFDTAADEHVQFSIAFPKSWNLGTVTAQFFWSNASGTGTVSFAIQGMALADSDVLDTAFGTAVVTTDTMLTAGDLHVSPVSTAVTIAGTPGDDELVYFQVYRDVSADTLGVDARLHGVKLFYTTDAANDD